MTKRQLAVLPAVDCGPASNNKHPVTGGYQSYRNAGWLDVREVRLRMRYSEAAKTRQ